MASQSQFAAQVQAPQPPLPAETPQPTPVMPPESPKKSILKSLLIIIILGLLAGGVGISYTFIKDKGGRQDGQQDVSFGPTTFEPKLGKSVTDNFEGVAL